MGPSILVLGDKARQYGLDISLLERLLCLYQQHIDITTNHLLILSTNYRCHPAIRNFARNLFYCNFDLKSPQQYQLPHSHPRYPKCLLFVCSSIEQNNIVNFDSNINEKEATILLKVLKDIAFFNWPKEWGMRDLLKCCIMSPCRSQVSLKILITTRHYIFVLIMQLTVINQLMHDWSKGYSMLRKVCRRPTYDIQGTSFNTTNRGACFAHSLLHSIKPPSFAYMICVVNRSMKGHTLQARGHSKIKDVDWLYKGYRSAWQLGPPYICVLEHSIEHVYL